ncbi:MAG: MBL fold metallo-hydrolase [bacterium]
MAGHDLSVRLCGVRGSYPVSGQKFARYGGNTSCIEVRAKGHVIILDAGTGIIGLGNQLLPEIEQHTQKSGKPFVINILFSHTHHDHIQGLPYFAPAYQDKCVVNLYGTRTFSQSLQQIFSVYMAPQYSPIEMEELHARINIEHMNENDVLIFPAGADSPRLCRGADLPSPSNQEVVVSFLRNYAHPKIGTFVIKVSVNGKSAVYATDTEGYVGGDVRLSQFAKNANLLIHDAQYDVEHYAQTQGFGHSTYEMATTVARAAQVDNLVLFHHDPCHDDDKLHEMESKAKELFANTSAATEGQVFRF